MLLKAETTMMFTIEPVFATILAWLCLGESIGGNTVLGATCIIAACIWSTR